MIDKEKKIHAVILVNYNGIKDSIDCIESILKTENSESIKIVFVDNASTTDETVFIKKKYPNIYTIRSDINGGFSYGNNLGIQWALDYGYEYITLLNNDTVVAPDLFVRLEEYCSETCIAAPKMYYYSQPDLIWYDGGEINCKTGNGKHINKNCRDVYKSKEGFCSFVSGCCMMVKSETFQKFGLLEESYFMYFEDVEFCIRIQQNGVRIAYVPTAKLWHKVSASAGGSESPFCTYYLTRNRLNCVKKYKDYFNTGAYVFSLISRVARMLQSKDKDVKRAFEDGIRDHLRGISGKSVKY